MGGGRHGAHALVRLWVVTPYNVPSKSMLPTLKPGDLVYVNISTPAQPRPDHRVQPPQGRRCLRGNTLIKRAIGLPGETISFRGGQVFIDGQHLAQSYLPAGPQPGPRWARLGRPRPQGEYFMMATTARTATTAATSASSRRPGSTALPLSATGLHEPPSLLKLGQGRGLGAPRPTDDRDNGA